MTAEPTAIPEVLQRQLREMMVRYFVASLYAVTHKHDEVGLPDLALASAGGAVYATSDIYVSALAMGETRRGKEMDEGREERVRVKRVIRPGRSFMLACWVRCRAACAFVSLPPCPYMSSLLLPFLFLGVSIAVLIARTSFSRLLPF